jgi:hypothetical protein
VRFHLDSNDSADFVRFYLPLAWEAILGLVPVKWDAGVLPLLVAQ